MTERQGLLDKFSRVDAEYEAARERAEALKRDRDSVVLALADGQTVRGLAAELGLSPGRVQQVLDRARK